MSGTRVGSMTLNRNQRMASISVNLEPGQYDYVVKGSLTYLLNGSLVRFDMHGNGHIDVGNSTTYILNLIDEDKARRRSTVAFMPQ